MRYLVPVMVMLVVPAVRAQDDAVSPLKILLNMKRAYAGCRSYRDMGVVKTSSVVDQTGSFGSEQPFSTAFVRPDRFRYQCTDTGLGERSSTYVVWLEGPEVRAWWDAKPGVRRAESLQEALETATGISGGSSVRVPGMLLPDLVPEGPPLIAPERIEDGDDRGVACYRLRGKSRATPYTLNMGTKTITVQDETVTFWIDRASFLLRKVEELRTYDAYRSRITTTYTPELDVEIAPADLTFRAPDAR